MRILFFTFLILSCSYAKALSELHGHLVSYAEFESNVFYQDEKDLADASLVLQPQFQWLAKSTDVSLTTSADTKYKKYVSYAKNDQLDYSGQLNLALFEQSRWNAKLSAKYAALSDPAFNDVSLRFLRNEITGGGEISFRKSELATYRLGGKYWSRANQNADLVYLDASEFSGNFEFDYHFLPETSVYFMSEGGMTMYPNGTVMYNTIPGAGLVKTNSMFYSAGGGVRGRLTQTTTADILVRYMARIYEKYPDYASIKGQDFAEPVFRMQFDEQLTPRDLLVLGFEYDVKDSTYSNWMLDQEMFLGYSRVLGDQIIFLTRLSYEYRSFSAPFRREDQRVSINTRADYSYRMNWKYFGQLKIDFLNSDVIDRRSPAINVPPAADPATNYDAVTLSSGLEYSF